MHDDVHTACMTDPRLTKRDPDGRNRAQISAPRTDYVDCVKCGKVMREDRFVDHMRSQHPFRKETTR